MCFNLGPKAYGVKHNNSNNITFRLPIFNEKQWNQWLMDYSERSNTLWKITKTYQPIRLQLKKDYICQHNDYRTGNTKKKIRTTNTWLV